MTHVGADHQQRAHAVVSTERIEQLEGRLPGPGNRGLGNIPDGSHVAARHRIVDLPVTGKLVRLLAVLASPLPVSLAGDGPVAAERGAHLSERQRDVDIGERVVDALGLLLGTPAGQDDDPFRGAQRAGGFDELSLRHAGQPFDALGPVGRGELPHVVESFSPAGDIRRVDQVVGDEDMEDAVRQRRVRSRSRPQVSRRPLRGGRAAGVDHQQLAAVGPQGREVLHQRGHGLGDVAAGEQHDVGVRDVLERERKAAVKAEGAGRCRSRRRHAEAPVVVDVRRAQRHARELAEQVGFLVRQRAAAEDPGRVRAVACLHALDVPSHAIERGLPSGGDQRSACVAHQRIEQPIGMSQGIGCRPAFDAESSLVDGKVAVAGDRER